MNSAVSQTLDRLAERLNDLPEDVQADVLAEIEAKVEGLALTHLTEAQRALVVRRLAEPRDYASNEDVAAVLRRFNPTL